MSDKPTFEHPQSQTNQPSVGQVFSDSLDVSGLNQQIAELTRRIETIENKRINFNTDLIGLFETVTVAPTLIPTSPYEQIKLANISGTFYIYAYNTNSKTWKRVVIA